MSIHRELVLLHRMSAKEVGVFEGVNNPFFFLFFFALREPTMPRAREILASPTYRVS